MPDDEANPFRAARVRAGLTQTQVASKLGVRPATVVAWEQGTQPQEATLERIAELYGVDPAELRQALARDPRGREPDVDAAGFVRVRETTLAYWAGRFDTMADWAHALDALMQQQREQFARFTRGVTEFRESGLLPGPQVVTATPQEAAAAYEKYRVAGQRLMDEQTPRGEAGGA